MKPNINAVRFLAKDGVELHGILAGWDTNAGQHPIVIYTHGLAGNFYENRFVWELAEKLTLSKFAFLSFNNRGHDYINDLQVKLNDGWSSKNGGGAHEIFKECLYDIDGAIDFARLLGFTKFILAGHSSGCNKMVYYYHHRKMQDLLGLILLSPCDDVQIASNCSKKLGFDVLSYAKKLVGEGKENDLMPEGSFYSYPMSAHTYIDLFAPSGDHDIFPYRLPPFEAKLAYRLEVATCILLGSEDSAIGNLNDVESWWAQSFPPDLERHKISIISGAGHSFAGHEADLCQAVCKFFHLL